MNTELPNTNPVQDQPSFKNDIKMLFANIKQILNPLWLRFRETKFYTNKKIFLPVTIASSLIVLMILIGLIFGGRMSVQVQKSSPSPTPASSGATIVPSGAPDTLSQIEQKLTDDKNQINSLDVKESRLQPPTLDFKIKF